VLDHPFGSSLNPQFGATRASYQYCSSEALSRILGGSLELPECAFFMMGLECTNGAAD